MATMNEPKQDELAAIRLAINELADQLCASVEGCVDFTVDVSSRDESMQKLVMLINFLLDGSRRALKDIADREVQLRTVMETASEGIVSIDTSGRVRTFNDAAAHMFGYDADEVIGRNVSLLMPEGDARKHDTYLANYLGNKRPTVVGAKREVQGRRKDGTFFPMELAVSEVDVPGIHLFTAIIRDLTQQKKLQAQLLRNNEELLAVAKVHETLFRAESKADVAKTLTQAMVNDFGAFFARLWLVEPADLCQECALASHCPTKEQCLHLISSHGHYTHIDGDHRRVPLGSFKIGKIAQSAGKTICSDVLSDERVHDREWARQMGLKSFAGFPLIRDDTVIGVMAMFSKLELSPSILSSLELLGQLGVSAITQVEKAEDLRSSQQYATNIIGSMIDTLIVMDPSGRIVKANDAACRLLGYEANELVGRMANEIVVDNDDSKTARNQEQSNANVANSKPDLESGVMQALTSSGQVNGAEVFYIAKDERRIPVTFSGSVMRAADGSAQGMVCVAQDSSERKQLQVELSQAQKLEAVGQLAAGIAHEINTPTQYVGDNARFLKDAFSDINPVLDSLDKLLEAAKEGKADEKLLSEVEATLKQADVEYLREEIPQAIDQSLDGVERVAKIVRAMKEFSHPGSDEKTLIDLQKALETTITVARNEWKYVAEMETEFASDLPDVSCLPGELNQVFLNLIVNASHAIGDVLGEGSSQKGKITVGTRREGNWAAVFIRDTGGGIPEEIRSRIFDPFFTTKEVGKGTGQGLAIARSVVVDKHGGTIECDTVPGEGTTFIVKLPLKNTKEPIGEDSNASCALR